MHALHSCRDLSAVLGDLDKAGSDNVLEVRTLGKPRRQLEEGVTIAQKELDEVQTVVDGAFLRSVKGIMQ